MDLHVIMDQNFDEIIKILSLMYGEKSQNCSSIFYLFFAEEFGIFPRYRKRKYEENAILRVLKFQRIISIFLFLVLDG